MHLSLTVHERPYHFPLNQRQNVQVCLARRVKEIEWWMRPRFCLQEEGRRKTEEFKVERKTEDEGRGLNTKVTGGREQEI